MVEPTSGRIFLQGDDVTNRSAVLCSEALLVAALALTIDRLGGLAETRLRPRGLQVVPGGQEIHVRSTGHPGGAVRRGQEGRRRERCRLVRHGAAQQHLRDRSEQGRRSRYLEGVADPYTQIGTDCAFGEVFTTDGCIVAQDLETLEDDEDAADLARKFLIDNDIISG